MSPAIRIENISKQYRLGEIGTGSLAHDVNRWWHRLRGKEDPYLKIGETNDRSVKGSSDYVWALRDVSFDVVQGEVLGIIGRNGAGKSTLLKILSRVTSPTSGTIRAKGRIASLLEVGTGFHPELTGRENIYLNGAILGMRKHEITRKLDEIISFSGCERYIDTPVKRYSSGMYVRLAFAVAANLSCEILIVDEVLSVGDAEFQERCLGKMREVSTSGRTVIFVSHNIPAIRDLCTSGVLFQNGQTDGARTVSECIQGYMATQLPGRSKIVHIPKTATGPRFVALDLHSPTINYGDSLHLSIDLASTEDAEVAIEVDIKDSSGSPVIYTSTAPLGNQLFPLRAGQSERLNVGIGPLLLAKGGYFVSLSLIKPWRYMYHAIKDALHFEVVKSDPGGSGFDFQQGYGRGSHSAVITVNTNDKDE